MIFFSSQLCTTDRRRSSDVDDVNFIAESTNVFSLIMRFAFLLLGLLPLAAVAKEYPVNDLEALHAAVKESQPGDVILMREGEWEDTVVKFVAQGTAEAPITLRAAVAGKTILTGKSGLRIGGEHLVVEGLWFKDLNTTSVGDAIEFRLDSKKLAHHCRLTQCAITLDRSQGSLTDDESRWLGLYGSEHRVDHCLIQGKLSAGATMVVWLGAEPEGRHRIDHNYFGPREVLGKNGGETIRIGDSETSMRTAACIVESNLFEKCNGEVECISNKSCGNLYRENTFLEVSGTLSLRHGNACKVERNVFLGKGAKGTGGIRIIGEDHVVMSNYLEGLAGEDMRSALTFMLGVVNSPANGYFQVKRARVEKNVVRNCQHPILLGMQGSRVKAAPSLAPLETLIIGNLIDCPDAADVVEARCLLDGVSWQDNVFWGKSLGLPAIKGIEWKQPEIRVAEPIARSEVGPSWWD